MVRRLGEMERVALWFAKELADQGGSVTRRRVAALVFAPDPGQAGPFAPPTRAQMSSFHRAVRSLAGKGLFRKAEWTGVLKVTSSGRQALDDLRYSSKNADLDRKAVCRGRKRLRPRAVGGSLPPAGRNPAGRTSVSGAGAPATP